jgi:hypothetical protein
MKVVGMQEINTELFLSGSEIEIIWHDVSPII